MLNVLGVVELSNAPLERLIFNFVLKIMVQLTYQYLLSGCFDCWLSFKQYKIRCSRRARLSIIATARFFTTNAVDQSNFEGKRARSQFLCILTVEINLRNTVVIDVCARVPRTGLKSKNYGRPFERRIFKSWSCDVSRA